MSRSASFKQADCERALRAAVRAGLSPSGFRIEAGGAIVVMFEDTPAVKRNPLDRLLER